MPDLPPDRLKPLIETFDTATQDTRLGPLSGHGLTPPQPLTPDLIDQVTSRQADYDGLLGKLAPEIHLQLWLSPGPDDATFDAERVFFAEDLCPTDPTAGCRALEAIVGLTHQLAGPQSRLAFTDDEVTSPRDAPDAPHVIWF